MACHLYVTPGRNDGWGSQHIRRALLFVHAVQLGCIYHHLPITTMNAASSAHGIAHTEAENFFGLGTACGAHEPLPHPSSTRRLPCDDVFKGLLGRIDPSVKQVR